MVKMYGAETIIYRNYENFNRDVSASNKILHIPNHFGAIVKVPSTFGGDSSYCFLVKELKYLE